jgi:acyl carrier protein
VFHLASAADPALHWKDMDRYRVSVQGVDVYDAMFRSKVYGTWAIHRLLTERPEAICVAFSSVISLFGGATFGAYAAAQSFLNSYSLRRRPNGQPGAHCFIWSVWDEMGMSKRDPAFVRNIYRSAGYFVIPEEKGIDSLIAALSRGQSDLVIGLDRSKPNVHRLLDDAQPLQKLVACYTGRDGATAAPGLEGLTVRDRFGAESRCELDRLETMPLTSTGEVDQDALRMLRQEKGAAVDQGGAPPRTETEKRIADIWRDVLAISRPGIHDGFFQIGGNSLTATQVLSRLRQAFQVRLDMRDLFEHATIAELATLVQERRDRQVPQTEPDTMESLDPETLLGRVAHMSDTQVAELLQRLQAEEEHR